MNSKGVWIAFGVGVSAGVAIVLFCAPGGAKIRKRLGKSIDGGADYLQDAADYLKKQAEDLASQAQKAIERTRNQVQDAVDLAAGKATGAVKSIHSLM